MNLYKGLFDHAVIKFLQSLHIRVLMFVTGLARVGYRWILHGVFRQQGQENVRVDIPRFGALGDSGHVATDAV